MAGPDDYEKLARKFASSTAKDIARAEETKGLADLAVPGILIPELTQDAEMQESIHNFALAAYAYATGQDKGWSPDSEERNDILSKVYAFPNRKREGGYVLKVPTDSDDEFVFVVLPDYVAQRPN